MFDFISDNKDWIFSGIGVFVLGGIITFVKMLRSRKSLSPNSNMNQHNVNNSSGTQIGIQNNYYSKENSNE